MINRILHSWSVNMKFMERRLAKYRNYTTRSINFILNDHSCKILYLLSKTHDSLESNDTKIIGYNDINNKKE